MTDVMVGRASQLTPQAIERMISAGIQTALRIMDEDYRILKVRLIEEAEYWNLYLEVEDEAGKAPIPLPQPEVDPEDIWTRP